VFEWSEFSQAKQLEQKHKYTLAANDDKKGWMSFGMYRDNDTMVSVYFFDFASKGVGLGQMMLNDITTRKPSIPLAWPKENTEEDVYSEQPWASLVVVEAFRPFTRGRYDRIIFFGNSNQTLNTTDMYHVGSLEAPNFVVDIDSHKVKGTNQCFSDKRAFFHYTYWYPHYFIHISSILSLIFDCLVLIALIVMNSMLYRSRLLYSRQPTPFVILILLLMFRVLLYVDYILQYSIYEGRDYVSFAVLGAFVFSIAVVFASIHLFRYLYIRNIYKVVQTNLTSDIDRNLIIHKRLTSKGAFLIALAITGLLLLIPVLLFHLGTLLSDLGIFSSDQSDKYYAVMVLFICLLPIISCALCLITVVVEVILNWKNIRKRSLTWYFFFDDPLLQRLEVLLSLIVAGPFVISGTVIASLIFAQVFKVTPCPRDSCKILSGVIRWIIYSWNFSPAIWTFAFSAGGGFACCVEIYRMIGGQSGKKEGPTKDQTSLTKFLEDEDCAELFATYCSREFSLENYKLFVRLRGIQERDNLPFEEFQKLYNTFIREGSALQVNVSATVVRDLSQVFKRTDMDVVRFEELKQLDTELKVNLTDTFQRFSKNKECEEAMIKLKIKQELMDTTYAFEKSQSPEN